MKGAVAKVCYLRGSGKATCAGEGQEAEQRQCRNVQLVGHHLFLNTLH